MNGKDMSPQGILPLHLEGAQGGPGLLLQAHNLCAFGEPGLMNLEFFKILSTSLVSILMSN